MKRIAPKESWFIPFGHVNGVELIQIYSIRKFRENTGGTCSYGTQLLKLEEMFAGSTPVRSLTREPGEGCTYYLRGQSESERPGTLFVVRDGAIIAIKVVSRSEWEVLP